MAPSISVQSTRLRQSRQDRGFQGRRDVRILRRLVGDVVEVHVLGARSFIGIVTVVDSRSRLLQMNQLADNRGVFIRIDAILAIEQGRTDEVWALVPEEGAA